MNDKHCTFHVALLAKEKGFKMTSNPHGFITKFYHGKTGTEMSYGFTGRSKIENLVYKPTQTDLQTWLRETHKIFVSVLPFQDIEDNIDLCWYYSLVNYNEVTNENILCNENDLCASFENFESYEIALEEGLHIALKFIK